MVRAKLIKPLDGDPEGSIREFDKADFHRLKDLHAVIEAPDEEAPPEGAKQDDPPANKKAPAPKNKAEG